MYVVFYIFWLVLLGQVLKSDYTTMYFLIKCCFICWNNSVEVNKLNSGSKGASYFEKLVDCIPELNISDLQDQYVCTKCSEEIDAMYNFRFKCLTSTITIKNHLEKLQTYSNKRGDISVKLLNLIYAFINVKQNECSMDVPKRSELKRRLNESNCLLENTKKMCASSQTLNNSISTKHTKILVDQNSNIVKDSTRKTKIQENKCIVKLDLNAIFKENDSNNALDLILSDEEIKKEVNSNGDENFNLNFDKFSENQIPQLEHVKKEIDFDTLRYHFDAEYIVTTGESEKSSPTTKTNDSDKIPNSNIEQEVNQLKTSMNNRSDIGRHFDYDSLQLEEVMLKEEHYQDENDSKIIFQDLIGTNYYKDTQMKHNEEKTPKKVLNENQNIINVKYKCKECNKIFKQSCHLNRHVLTHAQEKPYQCDICQKKFSKKDVHDKHKKFHDPDNLPFACKNCNRKFSQKWDLMAHNLIHTGVKPFACHICGRLFSRKGNMTYHINTKHQDIIYRCSICSRTFNREIDLNKHGLMHTGEKYYECTYCSKIFNREDNLKCHLKAHVENKNDYFDDL